MESIGKVQNISGRFFAKDLNGNIRELKEGDTIYENELIYGDKNNASSDKIIVGLIDTDLIKISADEMQLLDSSLVEVAYGDEEMIFVDENLEALLRTGGITDVVSDLRDANFIGRNLNFVESISDDELDRDLEDDEEGTSSFSVRDGNATDVVSDLRDARFKSKTQNFEDKNLFENESEDRLSSDSNQRDTSNPFLDTNMENNSQASTDNNVVDNNSLDEILEDNTNSIVTKENDNENPLDGNGESSNDDTEDDDIEEILKDDVKLSIADSTAYENDGFLVFTVTLDEAASDDISFTYSTSDGTAISSKDYEATSSTVTIPKGSTSIEIKVPIIDDNILDDNETLKVNISNVTGNVEILKGEATGTILDKTSTPDMVTVNIVDNVINVEEGNIGSFPIQLLDSDNNPVVVPEGASVTVDVAYSGTDGNGVDFSGVTQVVIPAGSSSVNLDITALDDAFDEGSETLNITISNPQDGGAFEAISLGNSTADMNIVDEANPADKDTVTVNIVDNVTDVEEGNIGSFPIQLVDSNNNPVVVPAGASITVDVAYSGTDGNGVDFNGDES